MKQKNTGQIFKSKTTERFTQIPNEVLRDPNLSLKAKGLLGMLLSLPSDWCIYKTQLPQFTKDGRDGTIAAFDELIENGFIAAIRKINSKGQFEGWSYIVYNERTVQNPEPITDKPITEKPNSVNPISENTSLQIKIEQIKNVQIKNVQNTGTNILGKFELKNIICNNLNLRTEQFNIFVDDNFQSYWNKNKLDANKELINQYINYGK